MKRFLISPYTYLLYRLAEAQKDLLHYLYLHGSQDTIIYDCLLFKIAFQNLLLEIYKHFLPKKWTKE